MARYVYQSQIKDGGGRVIDGATVSVVLAGTSTPASVYTSKTSTTVVNSVTSNSHGYFSFYFDDFDYDSAQTFDLTVTASGYVDQSYSSVRPEVVPGTYTISTAKTVTTNINVPSGVTYVKSGSGTIAFTGSFAAGLYQVFSGFSAGNITFGTGAIIDAYPQWWGGDDSGATSSSTAIQCAIASTMSGTRAGSVKLTAGTWKCNFNLANKLRLSGVSTATILVPDTNAPVIATPATTALTEIVLKDFIIDGTTNQLTYTSQDGINLTAAASYYIDGFRMDNVTIKNCGRYGVYADGQSLTGNGFIQSLTLRGCAMYDNTDAGFYGKGSLLETRFYDTFIYRNGDATHPNCYFINNGSEYSHGVGMHGCVLNGTVATPGITALRMANVDGVSIDHCDFEGGDPLIYISGTTSRAISICGGNRFTSQISVDKAILVDFVNGFECKNNLFTSTTTFNYAIYFNGAYANFINIGELDNIYNPNALTAAVAYSTAHQAISGGVIRAYRNVMMLDTESAAATDNLDTIYDFKGAALALYDGRKITLQSLSDAHVITVTNSGNIVPNGGSRVLTTVAQRLVLQWNSANSKWYEISYI